MIAALFVEKGGVYCGLPDVDPWDEARDARTYAGPWPVVAHPPCSTWCRLAGLNEARWGRQRGQDGGAFQAALSAVRRWGGVLEHPAYSDAWAAFGLNAPPRKGAWVNADFEGGWTCCVEQHRYGHLARKATWLYAVGVELAPLRWGVTERAPVLVSACANHTQPGDERPRIMKKHAAATPPEFRDVLLDMARSATRLKAG